jgi:hypothetical protein
MPKTQQAEGGSPKVPEKWPVVELSGYAAGTYRRTGESTAAYPQETYIPVSALLSGEVKGRMLDLLGERGWHATGTPEEAAEPDLATAVAKAHRDLGDALKAAVDHLGGTDAH